MTAPEPMPTARRRPIPGTTRHTQTNPAAPPSDAHDGGSENSREELHDLPASTDGVVSRRPASDYGATRLVNFRLPVDLHDRYRQLVQDTERAHPRLRRPSLTELVIALLEEGPQNTDEIARLIRRKRTAEHQER
jgi:hypothetical protein